MKRIPGWTNSSKSLWGALFVVVILILPETSGAIPAFARKYKMSCSTCHAPMPRLKEYGEDFAGNAFQLEDQEPPRYFHDTGDEILTLMRDLPLAIRFDSYLRVTDQEEKSSPDFQIPYYLKILSGGQIFKRVGYYFYFFLSERGEVAGVEDAYLHFNDLLGADFDLMVGQFQVSDPLFKRELRITYEDYQIYRIKVGPSPTNLTYDRGVMATFGSPFGTDVVFELVNGNGIGEADQSRNFDSDDSKNVFLRLSQSLGMLRLGAFSYVAKSEAEEYENDISYFGFDGTVDVDDILQVNAQYVHRQDDNPTFVDTAGEVETQGGLLEAIWAVQGGNGRHFVTFLYNLVDSDWDGLDYLTATLSYSYLLRRNLRLVGEVTYDDESETYRMTGGFSAGF
jgi:hypothetical protein